MTAIGEQLHRTSRFGWMNGVKIALNARVMTVEATCQCVMNSVEWRVLVRE